MKKSDLKTGMVVETARGEKYLVMLNPDCEGRDLISFDRGYMPLSKYENDLTYINEPEWDIVKVYTLGTSIYYILATNANHNRKLVYNLIWERKENPVEMTIEEIEKKLGIKNLKIVKE